MQDLKMDHQNSTQRNIDDVDLLFSSSKIQAQNQRIHLQSMKNQSSFKKENIKVMAIWLLIPVILGILCGIGHYILQEEIQQLRQEQTIISEEISKNKKDIQHNITEVLKSQELTKNEVKIEKVYRIIEKQQRQIEKKQKEIEKQQRKKEKKQRQIEKKQREIMEQKNIKQATIFPKILWFYTQFRFDSEKMLEQLLGNFIIQKARQSNLEIRFVNSWSAYKWLSDDIASKITKTMQNSKLQEKVDDLLRMALLLEHGGIAIKLDEIFYIAKDFQWMKEYLRFNFMSQAKSEVLLYAEQQQSSKPQYQDFFIAAVKGAALIRDTFNILSHVIMTGELQFQRLRQAQYIREEVNSTRVRNLTRNIIHSLIDYMNLQYYGVDVLNTDVSLFLRPQCRDQLIPLLKNTTKEYQEKCGQPKHIIHISQVDRLKFENQLEQELTNQALGADQNGYWYTWMMIPENRRLFEPSPPREIFFCLLDAHPSSDFSLLQNSFQRLKNQTFKVWKAVYFMDQENSEAIAYSEKQNKEGYNITLVTHTGSVGRNYEVGIINYCPKKSFVVVLKREESIANNEGLSLISHAIAPRSILGAFIGVNISGEIRHSQTYFQWYNRLQHNGKVPDFEVLNKVLNYLRVFHSDCYKIIPQFQLRSPEGVYFDNRFAFLEQMLFMVRNLIGIHDTMEIEHIQKVKWYIKSNQNFFDVPKSIILNKDLVINIIKWEEVDKDEIKRNHFKSDSFPMTYNMDHLVQNGIPMSQFAVFNPGLEYEPYTVRNKPAIIPKIIHGIWIDGNLPEVKQKIFDLRKELYPDFQFKLWSKKDITMDKFPMTYDLLQTVYNMENISRYSKRATMADIMRHELMYHEGGFYLDSSMFLFSNVFYKWLSYKLVLSTERTFRHRWSQSMCIFGVMPKFSGLLRIISPNNTNRYNLWLKDALEIAGPNNFRWTVRGMEEYDPDYLIMEYDAFYPMTYDLPNMYDTYCLAHPQDLSQEDEVIFQYTGLKMIKNCGKYYPYSFGREPSVIGGSWTRSKW